ncbi:MAG: aminotransferase class I/II-fold pyridoxal phosphate-dependent enzyme [Cyanobacteria bacterium P01_H01_bin.15]
MTMVNPSSNGASALASFSNSNGNGKIASPLLASTPTEEAIHAWLVEQLSQRLELESQDIDPDEDLTEYGLDSVEAVNLSGELETFLGRRLPPTLLWDYPTLSALAEYLGNAPADIASAMSPHRPSAVDLDEIPEEHYTFELSPEYQELQGRLQQLEQSGLGNPFFQPQSGIVNNTTQIDGRELINFATYNYVGMSGDPAVSKAAVNAISQYGTSVSASRLISGEKPLHRELEQEIASFIGTEDAIVLVGGHATNVTTISHLFGTGDLIVYDGLSHNSILQGCQQSGASLLTFPHNDWNALEALLADRRQNYRRVLIVIEGVYSTDGDIPDLPRFIELKKRYQTYLMVDEAHSIGVLGATGRGISEYFGINPADVDLWMGTLSKSLASCGGYIAGSKAIVDYLKYTAPGFVFSVGISPPNAAATLAAIRTLKAEPERVARLRDRSRLFLTLAQEQDLNTGTSYDSPVIPIIVGDDLKSVQLSRQLFVRGINVPFMIYPSVPKGSARLRFFITCDHTEAQIRKTVAILSEEVAKLNQPDSSAVA